MSETTETAEVQQPEIIGTVAIVGFPNVGKSTLINRLTVSRQAVVHETPGVTRDRKELLADWNGKHFLLIDTGGVDDFATDPFSPEIAKQARAAIAEADLVLFVVDARHGITPGDEELAVTLRASKKPVLVLANKIDDPRRDLDAVEQVAGAVPVQGGERERVTESELVELDGLEILARVVDLVREHDHRLLRGRRVPQARTR